MGIEKDTLITGAAAAAAGVAGAAAAGPAGAVVAAGVAGAATRRYLNSDEDSATDSAEVD